MSVTMLVLLFSGIAQRQLTILVPIVKKMAEELNNVGQLCQEGRVCKLLQSGERRFTQRTLSEPSSISLCSAILPLMSPTMLVSSLVEWLDILVTRIVEASARQFQPKVQFNW